jgi:uncharacterized protein YdhG (YjbR/CyaY superfamily)
VSPDVQAYFDALPEHRRERLLALREVFLKAEKGVEESMRYKMPTYEKDGNGVSIGNQKNHICMYFCCAELVADIREKHPKLSIGTGCVRIRDTQPVPTEDLKKAFKNALKMKK